MPPHTFKLQKLTLPMTGPIVHISGQVNRQGRPKTMSKADPGSITIRHEAAPHDFAAIAVLWGDIRWGRPDQEAMVERALGGSDWIAIAEIDGQFAGYGRAFSDSVIVTYLTEVAVVPAFRRRGVATAIVKDCLDCFSETSIYADAGPEILPLLQRIGLLPRPRYLTACSRAAVTEADHRAADAAY